MNDSANNSTCAAYDENAGDMFGETEYDESSQTPDVSMETPNVLSNQSQVCEQSCSVNGPAGDEMSVAFLIHQRMQPVLRRCTKNGQTPMMVACVSGCLKLVRQLALTSEVDINRRDSEGNTALILAAHAGHTEIIRFLLWNFEDIEVDAMNNFGMTALMKSALRGHSLCARILIVAGADIEKRDWSRKYCAYEWATLCGFKLTAKAIKNVGAAGPMHIGRQEVQCQEKKAKFALARNAYSKVKRKITTTFCGNGNDWMDRAGALYYLVESTAQPANVMWPLSWSKQYAQGPGNEASQDDDEQFSEIVSTSESGSLSFGTETPTLPRRPRSFSHFPKEPPTIYCIPSSPVLKRKDKTKSHLKVPAKNDNTKNWLEVPTRKSKITPK